MFGSTDLETRRKNGETYMDWKGRFAEKFKTLRKNMTGPETQNCWLDSYVQLQYDPTSRVMVTMPLIIYQIENGILTDLMEDELYGVEEDIEEGLLDELPVEELAEIKKDLEYCFSKLYMLNSMSENVEEQYEVKEYCYDSLGRKLPVGPSFEDVPMGGHVISCPICRACLNQYINDEKKIKCKAIGDIPEELNERKSFRCDHFEPDQSSFDYNLVMRLMENENKI